MASLQGFHEISLAAPASKAVMTITSAAIRFNKATAAELGYPSHVRVLVNESAKQVAIQACSADKENAIKFSKSADKQTGSVSIKAPAVLVTICSFFELHNLSNDEIDYHSIQSVSQPDDKASIFDITDAKSGTMKKRGRRKVADAPPMARTRPIKAGRVMARHDDIPS